MHLPVPGPVTVGSRVFVSDADGVEEYTIASEEEVDPIAGRISTNSPVGKAVLGRQVGERIAVRTPGGVRVVTIAAVTC